MLMIRMARPQHQCWYKCYLGHQAKSYKNIIFMKQQNHIHHKLLKNEFKHKNVIRWNEDNNVLKDMA